MLKVNNNLNIKEELKSVKISEDISIYTRVMSSKEENNVAIYIHGGGSGGNHTMLVRPSKWMIEKGFFDKIILPDRRGEGLSSSLTQKITIKDHALDMKRLLDKLDIQGKVTAMGISYGGPIALSLASIDERINEVVLFASSPSLKAANGLTSFLNNHNLLEPIVKIFYKKLVGKNPPKYADLDSIYDIKSNKELNKIYTDAIKSTDKKMLNSLILQNASTLDINNNSIEENVKLNIPIYQIIGDKDEVWEKDLSSYESRFPNLKTMIIPNANHKASLLRASEFYEAFENIYNDCNQLTS